MALNYRRNLMLILSRKKDEKIIIADEIEIWILEVGRNRVRFGIKAPKHILIDVHTKTLPENGDQSAEIPKSHQSFYRPSKS